MESNVIFVNTDVPFANIYDKTFNQLIKVNRAFFDDCNANNLLLLNGLYLTIQDMILKMMDTNKIEGGSGKRKRKNNKTRQKKLANHKNKNKNKRNNKKTKKHKKHLHGGNKNWISKLIFSLMSVILIISKNVFSLQPEYDNDVVKRLINAGEIKELFENKHGTCAINTALFLGSINLKTYSEVTEKIVKRGHGLTFSEATSYLNSSLKTLWEWESVLNNDLTRNSNTNSNSLLHSQTRYLRGSLNINKDEQKHEKITLYVQLLKEKLIQMRNNMTHTPEQGILTALSYPSFSVQHAVVAWLTSDETFVIIDPQEFMQGNVVLYVDNVSKLSILPNHFLKVGMDNYFMKYFDERENGATIILRDMHIRKEEHLEEMTRENPMINEVIEKIKLLENVNT